MTRPYDAVETDEELDSLFGGPEPTRTRRDTRAPSEEPAETNQLPEPICALHAPPPVPISWVVQDLFTSGDIGLIVGDGGSFKSSAALHIAAAIAGGYKAFDRFETCGPSPVLVCSAEDPGSVIQMRLEAFVRGHGWDRTRVLKNFHYFALAGIRLKDSRWKRHLTDTVARLEPAMVVLDPFVDLSGLEEENSNSEASGVMGFARQLARDSHASVPFVHHASKATERSSGRSQSRVRGATTIANASRGTLFFEFTEAGVMVEQVKMTYAEKVPTFMLTRDIQSEPTNRAQWISARLATVKPADARRTRAEEFVLAQVIASPLVLNTRGLRDAAKGSGIWPEDISSGLKSLYAAGLIDCQIGPRKEKSWFATDLGKVSKDRVELSSTHSTQYCVDRVEPPPTRSNGTGATVYSLQEYTHGSPPNTVPVDGDTSVGPAELPSDAGLAWTPTDDPGFWDDVDEIEDDEL